jgi:hypothetical protein
MPRHPHLGRCSCRTGVSCSRAACVMDMLQFLGNGGAATGSSSICKVGAHHESIDGVRMCGFVIEYHTRLCKEVTTEDEIGRNLDDGIISRMSLTFILSG